MMDGYKGIVGSRDNRTYAVVSNKYKVIQHRVIIDAMSEAADSSGVRIFGKTYDLKGRFNGYAWFSNPSCHIFIDDVKYDPMILGFRFYNSCLGDCMLGGEIVGIRCVCGNVGVFGEILGQVNFRHFKGVEYVSKAISNLLKTYINNKERFNNAVHVMKDMTLDEKEREAILWGLKLDPRTIERVISNRNGLNPEITDLKKVSIFDLYNVTTAYVTYRSGSDKQIQTNTELSSKIAKLFKLNASELIDDGIKEMEQYYSEQESIAPMITVV